MLVLNNCTFLFCHFCTFLYWHLHSYNQSWSTSFGLFIPSLHFHYRSFLATMESADFLSFVVTRFPSTRPHGISRTSFLVYSRNLRTWATSIFLDFSALSHLIHPIRLIIAFLFVEPRFRYPFLSPLPHDSQAWESLTGSPIASALWDFHPRCTTCPSYSKSTEQNRSVLSYC